MFSVIMPIHNKAPHLRRSIDSVLSQTYGDFELILIDDCSTDGSDKILDSYHDRRIKKMYRATPGAGGYAARNLGVRNASFEWISFIDADDTWERNFLENKAKAIRENDGIEFLTANWDNVYSGKVVENKFFSKFKELYVEFGLIDFLRQNYFVWTSATTIRKDLLIRAGMFPEDRCKRGGDMDAWIRCLELSRLNVWINIKLAHYFKETVNQVTSNKHNPVAEICALSTINRIRKASASQELHDALDVFLAKVLYNKVIADYRAGRSTSPTYIDSIKSLWIRVRLRAKIYLRIALMERKAR